MLKKLKFRFILLAMVSMTLTLTIAFAAVNITLRLQMSQNTDIIIETLHENGGHFSLFKHADDFGFARDSELDTDRPPNSDQDMFKPPDRGKFMHSETPYETRYYVAYIDENSTLINADFGHIALSNIETIEKQIETITQNCKTSGYIDNYRYGKFETDDGLMIIGVDCSNYLSTIQMLTTITLVTILSCIVIVLILLLVFSNRVLRPFEENREKQRRFITDAGHELKTPIAIIQSNTEVMEMIDGESKWLTNIKQQTERMSKLVKGLIELSKMDEQTVSEKEKQQIILSEIVFNSVESFRVPAEAKQIHLTSEIAPDVAVMGDFEDIVRTVGILLDNAIKYTDDRKEMTVKLYAKSKKAVLKVSNSCKGLDKASISKFFDRFYRTDESRSSETGGYGIGLSMAQMIVQNHKGKLNVSYSDDEIITFTMELSLS